MNNKGGYKQIIRNDIMDIELNNRDGKTYINVSFDNVEYSIVTNEVYDSQNRQHVSSAMIDTTGFPSPSFNKEEIIKGLSRNGIIVDEE